MLFRKGEIDLFETVKMSAVALRHIMNETFDYDKFERGRQEAEKLSNQHRISWHDEEITDISLEEV